MKLSSPDFEDGGELAEKFSCRGEGIRPNLNWSEIPPNAKSLAISMVDPDAPSGNFIHWLCADVLPTTSGIKSIEKIGREFPNSGGKTAYIPPCPPSGKHRYIFTLYALDVDNLNDDDFFAATASHAIDQAKNTGYFGRG